MAGPNNARDKKNNGANLGFEQKLWQMADKLHGHMDASEYKHVVLGLIFLKYISGAFQERHLDEQTHTLAVNAYGARSCFQHP
jgi:type I restriction-modification system DNA methylase subunit